MLITSDTKERVEIPHEAGEWLEVRALTWPEKEAASKERQQSAMDQAAKMPPEMFAAIQDMDRDQSQNEKFDLGLVLKGGLVGWSYTEPLNRESLRALDDRTAQFAFGEIMARSQFSRAEGNESTPPSTLGRSDTKKDGP